MVTTLRVVTWNVEHGAGWAEAAEALGTRPALRDADLIVLQELDEHTVARMADRVGMSAVYHPAAVHPRTRRNFGNAILSRWPLHDDRRLGLPHTSWVDGFARAAVIATATIAGRRLRVYSVHLSHLLEIPYWRITDQLRAVVRDAATSPDPVLVAGDLNSITAGRLMERAGYHWVTRQVGRTRWIWSIDHVFVRGLAPEGARAGVERDATLPSDHHPVWAVVPLDGFLSTSGVRT